MSDEIITEASTEEEQLNRLIKLSWEAARKECNQMAQNFDEHERMMKHLHGVITHLGDCAEMFKKILALRGKLAEKERR